MADISNIINVSLQEEGQAASSDNMNIVVIITGNQGVLSSAERFRSYALSSGVDTDFGASSVEAAFANAAFGTKPNPIGVDGQICMAYWRASDETVAEIAATLVSEQKTEASLIPILQAIDDGSFTITVDGGTEQVITALDFQTISDFDDVVTILNAAITDATVTESNGYFTIASDTTGATSLLTYAGTATSGTDISSALGLSSSDSSVLTQGADASVLSAETKLEALAAIKAELNFKGACFIDQILDADVPGIASWSSANDVLMYETFSGADYLEKDITNPVWAVKLAGIDNFRCLYSAAGNRKFSAAYMSRMHSVNQDGENTAITMNLKEIEIVAEDYTQTEIDQAYAVGVDLYTTIKDVSVVLCSPANGFADYRYNVIALVDAVKTGNFNFLKTTTTKVPQTDDGISSIEDDTEKTLDRFIRNGVGAPGSWTLPDTFGDVDQFNTNIETKGYYVLAGDLAEQSTADRQNRISPVIQIAFKMAGAVHKEDIIIVVNK